MKPSIILVLDNIRSSYNVGSLLRSADGFGVSSVLTVGITPHVEQSNDTRLPHVIHKTTKQIEKTALGGEHLLSHHFQNQNDTLTFLRQNNFQIISIEQDEKGVSLTDLNQLESNSALVLGNEIDGVSKEFLDASEMILEIPMVGVKESFNVSVSGAIAMFYISQMI